MSKMVKTCLANAFSENSMRMRLSIPMSPFRMPDAKGGRIIIGNYVDKVKCGESGEQGGSGGTNGQCRCIICTNKIACTGVSDFKCESNDGKKLDAFEIVEYSGYESDGVTLIITKRGVNGTSALNFGAGAEVVQEDMSYIEVCNFLAEIEETNEMVGG